MSDKTREAFEAALLSEKCASGDEMVKADWIERGSNGEYRSYFVRGAWWAWQASRAALVVELPLMTNNGYDGFYPAYAVKKAIHAAGVKTK